MCVVELLFGTEMTMLVVPLYNVCKTRRAASNTLRGYTDIALKMTQYIWDTSIASSRLAGGRMGLVGRGGGGVGMRQRWPLPAFQPVVVRGCSSASSSDQ